MKAITSLQNSQVKTWGLLHDRATRNERKQFLVEGYHLVREAHQAGILQELIITQEMDAMSGIPSTLVSMEIIQKIAKTKTPPGIMGICNMNNSNDLNRDRYLILDGIQDPGNLGTLIRSALGFGIEGIITTPNGVDMYHDKVLRATQGALFYLDIHVNPLEEILPLLLMQGVKLYGTDVEEGVFLHEITPPHRFAIVLGSEGQGLSSYAKKQVQQMVHIPTHDILESLNVAIAGSIILYQFMQRGGY
ncbi:MAG: RNA methyltransferase [Bacilli bacterium]